MRTFFLLLFLFLSTVTFSQKQKVEDILSQYEDSIKKIAPKILKGETDSIRIAANDRVTQLIEQTLKIKESFSYPFDSLKTIAHITSPDKTFRIYNWILPNTDGTYSFFGYLQTYDKKQKLTTTVKLIDQSDKIEKLEKSILTPEKWYGALYYKIVMNKYLGKRYYTLLGWKGYNKRSNKKVIDVLTFSGNKAKFGQPMFKLKKDTKHRIVFQYNIQAVMSLRYVDNEKAIIYDHLSPSNDNLKGQYEFYGPDFTYDAFHFKHGKWILTELFQAKNETDPGYKKPRKQPIHQVPIKKKE